jgi:hypothetical protein
MTTPKVITISGSKPALPVVGPHRHSSYEFTPRMLNPRKVEIHVSKDSTYIGSMKVEKYFNGREVSFRSVSTKGPHDLVICGCVPIPPGSPGPTFPDNSGRICPHPWPFPKPPSSNDLHLRVESDRFALDVGVIEGDKLGMRRFLEAPGVLMEAHPVSGVVFAFAVLAKHFSQHPRTLTHLFSTVASSAPGTPTKESTSSEKIEKTHGKVQDVANAACAAASLVDPTKIGAAFICGFALGWAIGGFLL